MLKQTRYNFDKAIRWLHGSLQLLQNEGESVDYGNSFMIPLQLCLPASRLAWLRSIANWQWVQHCLLVCLTVVSCLLLLNPAPALAGLTDDRYDGDIFALYAGNGSLIPPKATLAEALKRQRPALLVLYVDDSRDCKAYSTVVSQLQAFYGRAADFIAVRLDSIQPQSSYTPTDPGYYYKGVLPQTVLLDGAGKVRLNKAGVLAFERVDDVFREVFDLLPRSESVELKRRMVNEVTTELAR
jgi:hypothetical protein